MTLGLFLPVLVGLSARASVEKAKKTKKDTSTARRVADRMNCSCARQLWGPECFSLTLAVGRDSHRAPRTDACQGIKWRLLKSCYRFRLLRRLIISKSLSIKASSGMQACRNRLALLICGLVVSPTLLAQR